MYAIQGAAFINTLMSSDAQIGYQTLLKPDKWQLQKFQFKQKFTQYNKFDIRV